MEFNRIIQKSHLLLALAIAYPSYIYGQQVNAGSQNLGVSAVNVAFSQGTIQVEAIPGLDFETRLSSGQALARFFKNKVLPQIPESIRAEIGKTEIRVLADAKVDGRFVPPNRLEIRGALLTSENLKQLVAHEYFHAVHFALHPDEQPWVREGLAQIFENKVLGRYNGVNVAAAFKKISTPLEGDFDVSADGTPRIDKPQYGHVLLYFHYLLAQCSEELFWKITRGAAKDRFGADSIDGILKQSGNAKPQCASFAESATHFEIARAHNHVRYDLKNPDAFPAGADSKIHFLMSTTFAASSAAYSAEGAKISGLAQSKRFTPLVLSGETKTQALKGTLEVWLESSFPYSVRTVRPNLSNEELVRGWRVLLLKQ